MWYRHRHGYWRGGWGIPFIFPLVLLFGMHSMAGFVLTLLMAAIIGMIIRALMSAATTGYQQPYQPYQGYQQPYQPYQGYRPYQETHQAYQPYYQGYQAQEQRETYQGYEKEYQVPQYESYQEYEQPVAEYPEQMPPMQ